MSFEETITAFGDPLSLLWPDPSHSMGEERYLVLGVSDKQRLMVVALAEREPRTRLLHGHGASRPLAGTRAPKARRSGEPHPTCHSHEASAGEGASLRLRDRAGLYPV
ncbi:MAG: BrnT family toxin [Gemmatimonadota bacterium]